MNAAPTLKFAPYAFLLATVTVTVTCLCSCNGMSEKVDDKKSKTPAGQQLSSHHATSSRLSLTKERIESRVLAQELHVTGMIQPEVSNEIDISPRFAGRVVKICVALGERVHEGSVLAIVDSHDIGEIEAELVKATSELAISMAHNERERQIYEENLLRPKNLIEAQTRFAEAQLELELTEADFKRVEELHKEKITAFKDYLTARSHAAKAKLAYAETKSELQRQQNLYKNKAILQRDLHLAQAQTARTKGQADTLKQQLISLGVPSSVVRDVELNGHIVTAIPITASASGIVSEQSFAVGEMAGPDKKLFTISDLSTVVVIANIPEIDLQFVHIGAPVEVTVSAYPGQIFHGNIGFISEHVDSQTRSVAIRAQLNNKDHRLKAQMFAEIDVPGLQKRVVACPRDAIQDDSGKKVVFVCTDDSYKEREIKIGKEYKDYVEVLSGLSEGDVVAKTESLLLKTATAASNSRPNLDD